jgi:hypothetical protein
MTHKRGYSRDFPVTKHDDRCRYTLDNIPVELWQDVRRLAAEQGTSVRALLLTLLDR